MIGIPIGATGAPGEDGQPGGDGEDGHGVDLLDPALQGVLKPNQNPQIVVDNALPAKTFIGFKLPRARNFSFLPTLTKPPNTPAEFAYSHDTNGDIVGQFKVPAGAPGNSGGGGSIDNVEPAPGTTKRYDFMVDATGTSFPFVVPAGCILKNFAARGLWANALNDFPQFVRFRTGQHQGSSFPDQGDMVMNISDGNAPTVDGFFVMSGTDINPFQQFTFPHQTPVTLRQLYTPIEEGTRGYGQIYIEFDLERPLELRQDFYRLAVLASDPDRYWRCNELPGSTDLIDAIEGHLLTLDGTYTLGASGAYNGDNHRAIRFNGGGAKGAGIPFLFGDGAYTIEALVKMPGRTAWFWQGEDSSTSQDILAGYAPGFGGGHFWNGGSSNIVGEMPTASNWNHIVLTYDPTGTKVRRVYLNGQEIAFGNSTARNTSANSQTWLGRDFFQASDCYLSEVAIWSAPLAASVVTDHYNAYLQSINGF